MCTIIQKKVITALVFLTSLSNTPHSCKAQNGPQDYLKVHNAARVEVGVSPMAWNETVAAYAQNYANRRMKDCKLAHSDGDGGKYGENIFWGSGTGWTAVDASTDWVSEKRYYDYAGNSCAAGEMCGHYTQVVWRESMWVGCASVKCRSGDMFITCNYSPPGNYIGERPY